MGKAIEAGLGLVGLVPADRQANEPGLQGRAVAVATYRTIGEGDQSTDLHIRIGGRCLDDLLKGARLARKKRNQHGREGEADGIAHQRLQAVGRTGDPRNESGRRGLRLFRHEMQQEIGGDHVAVGGCLRIACAACQHLRGGRTDRRPVVPRPDHGL